MFFIRQKFTLILMTLIFLFISSESNFSKNYKLTILYTNDEHGWVETDSNHAGAANLYEIWNNVIKQEENVLLLSGGDNFAAAPPLSMETKGASTMDVFKALGHWVAPIGNHEFDFGVSVFKENQRRSNMTYLSANIESESTGLVPDYTRPYTIKQFNGFKVGILGLANIETPSLTNPNNIKGLQLRTYEESLKKYLPEIKEKADILIVLIHDCANKILTDYAVLSLFDEYNVAFVGAGHCHQFVNQKENNSIILETGSYLRNYGRVELTYDDLKKEVISSNSLILDNVKIERKLNKIDTIIRNYQNEIEVSQAINRKVIGKLERDYTRDKDDYYTFICKTWFESFPKADFALLNRGSIRQDLKKGDINISAIKLIMPFENTLYLVDVKGSNLIDELKNKKIIGCYKSSNNTIMYSDIKEIQPDKTYRIILPDFLYCGGDKVSIKSKCENLEETKLNYQEPMINYFIKYKIVK